MASPELIEELIRIIYSDPKLVEKLSPESRKQVNEVRARSRSTSPMNARQSRALSPATKRPRESSDSDPGDTDSIVTLSEKLSARTRKARKTHPVPLSSPASPTPSETGRPPVKKVAPQPQPTTSIATSEDMDTLSATEPAAQTVPKVRAPPPVYLRQKDTWTKVCDLMNIQRIQFTSATNTANGIRVQVPTSSDHRQLTKMLVAKNFPYHTYSLPEDRKLRVILRGIPYEIPTEAILEDLKCQQFPAHSVHRIIGRSKLPVDLVTVVLDLSPAGKAIYNDLRSVCKISGIKVEAPYKRGYPGQCHRCQLYGHAASNCTAAPRCVKCAGDHPTALCKRNAATDGPPSCILCSTSGHPANYRGCPRAPQPKIVRPAPSNKRPTVAAPSIAPNAALAPSITRRQNVSYAAIVAPKPLLRAPLNPNPQTTPSVGPSQPPSALADDMQYVLDTIKDINMTDFSILARKLRVATTKQHKITALLEHASLFESL